MLEDGTQGYVCWASLLQRRRVVTVGDEEIQTSGARLWIWTEADVNRICAPVAFITSPHWFSPSRSCYSNVNLSRRRSLSFDGSNLLIIYTICSPLPHSPLSLSLLSAAGAAYNGCCLSTNRCQKVVDEKSRISGAKACGWMLGIIHESCTISWTVAHSAPGDGRS